MGSWGYREICSDNGLDRMAGEPSFLSWARDNNNILDVDRCLKESEARYRSDPIYKRMELYEIEWDKLAMSEILYHFINNTVLFELGRLTANDSYGWCHVTKVVASKKAIKYLVDGLSKYLKGDMSKFETSGWFEKEVYNNRCKWITSIGQLLVKTANESKTDPITIYDKNTAKPELFIYKNRIKMTQNHELNRLRLFVKNNINYKYSYLNNNPHNKNKIYYEVTIRKDKQGNAFYALVFHSEEGKQSTVVKGKSPDELIRNAIEYQKKGGLSKFDWYIWNLYYNKNRYAMYCNYLKTHQSK